MQRGGPFSCVDTELIVMYGFDIFSTSAHFEARYFVSHRLGANRRSQLATKHDGEAEAETCQSLARVKEPMK